MAIGSKVFEKFDIASQGQWKEWNGIEFLIAPMYNITYKSQMAKNFTVDELNAYEQEGFVAAFKGQNAEASMSKLHKVHANSLIFNWKGYLDDDGKTEVPFSHEKAQQLFTDYPHFSTWVITQATEIFIERIKAKEEVVKN